jgi:acetyl-CoA carboxylase biotin carboxyl carrier protein
MEMSQEVMKALLEAFERSDWEEMTVTVGNDRLQLSRRAGVDVSAPAAAPASASVSVDGAAANAAGASAPAAYKSEQPAHRDSENRVPDRREELPAGAVIESPSVGLFWRAPSPGAPPFIEIGQAVSEGDTLAIVEVMKLMNHVVAPVGGVVVAILPENGEAVEHRQPLVVIDPES